MSEPAVDRPGLAEESHLMELYRQEGPGMLFRLGDAIFAFAVSDGRSLLMARDLLGIKTLFYGRKNGTLYAASEMKSLTDIDVAFLPMNVPYTMAPEMVADAARAFRPKVLYPYHYGETDPRHLLDLLADEPDIEIRIRRMK